MGVGPRVWFAVTYLSSGIDRYAYRPSQLLPSTNRAEAVCCGERLLK
jgi:hypothetical protein